MRVKKVGAVEQTDTSVYLCAVKRYRFHGFSLRFTDLAYIMIASLFGQTTCFRIFMGMANTENRIAVAGTLYVIDNYDCYSIILWNEDCT